MSAGLVFLDTETTGLSAFDSRIWELAMIIRDPDKAEIRMTYQVEGTRPSEFHPDARRVSRFDERYGKDCEMVSERYLAFAVNTMLAGRHIVGANPAFDQSFMVRLLADRGMSPTWKHRMIDVEVLAMGAYGWQRPMSLAQTADALCLRTDPALLHTAMGDAELARQVFDEVQTENARRKAVERPTRV